MDKKLIVTIFYMLVGLIVLSFVDANKPIVEATNKDLFLMFLGGSLLLRAAFIEQED